MSGSTTSLMKFASKEQQENLKNSRKTLKVLQQSATDKENLTGRPLNKLGGTKDFFAKSHFDTTEKNDLKRKKISSANKGIQTGSDLKITAEDLTSTEAPNEHYWEVLAERRRVALEEALEENRFLHEKMAELVEENKISKDMLEETKSLVEVLTEMLNEEGANASVAEEAIEGPTANEI